ncbi:hypothetical protein ACFV90_31025 [Streptomyces sp. NPDC059904]
MLEFFLDLVHPEGAIPFAATGPARHPRLDGGAVAGALSVTFG